MSLYLSMHGAHLGDEPRQPARPARVESALPQKHSCSRLHPSIHYAHCTPRPAALSHSEAALRDGASTASSLESSPNESALGQHRRVLARGGATRTSGTGSFGAKRISLAPRAMPSALADEALRSARAWEYPVSTLSVSGEYPVSAR